MRFLHHNAAMLGPLRSFLVVVKESSLHRAAAALRISQPALSRQMQALENELGGRLLERSTSGVSATAAGHALAAKLAPLLSAYDATMADVRRLLRGESEQLRIGYLASVARAYLEPALAQVRKAYPKVKIKLLDLSPGEQIAALRRGDIDLALTGQEGGLLQRDFYLRTLVTLPILAALPAEHPLAHRRRLKLADLKDERFIGTPESDLPGRQRWLTQLFRKHGGFRPRFILEASSLSDGFSLVVNEGAVAILPDYLRDYPTVGIAMIPISDPQARWDLSVAWQRGRTTGPLQALLAALATTAKAVGAKRLGKTSPPGRSLKTSG
jgi:DNA-binding transcriptional LysR family regulator